MSVRMHKFYILSVATGRYRAYRSPHHVSSASEPLVAPIFSGVLLQLSTKMCSCMIISMLQQCDIAESCDCQLYVNGPGRHAVECHRLESQSLVLQSPIKPDDRHMLEMS